MQTKYRNAIPNLDKETQFEKRMINGVKKIAKNQHKSPFQPKKTTKNTTDIQKRRKQKK